MKPMVKYQLTFDSKLFFPKLYFSKILVLVIELGSSSILVPKPNLVLNLILIPFQEIRHHFGSIFIN
jgi:hypothetical protein